MSSDIFKLFLSGLVQASGFNPEWYRDSYSDVALAIQRKTVTDELAHFVELGYQEGRLPAPASVNERWYRRKYSDVDEAIREGAFENSEEHYREFGRVEGRAADAELEDGAQRWFNAIERSLTSLAVPPSTATWDNFSKSKLRASSKRQKSRLERFFDARKEGNGIWKWRHYFDVYDRHFKKFVGTDVSILEIGVYSGGSLEMWRDYFGPKARIYGVDIEEACTVYNRDGVEILIGDQGDPNFWQEFKKRVPTLDIAIDDGSHDPEHMVLTLEELLPHVRPGGVYLCEDVHAERHPFASYVYSLADKLNNFDSPFANEEDRDRYRGCATTTFQESVGSVHLYPYVAVIERNEAPAEEFLAPRHGTQWQPFFDSPESVQPAPQGPEKAP